MPFDGENSWLYDNSDSVDRLLAVGDWVKRSKHCKGCHTVLRSNAATYVKMPYIRCVEGQLYAWRLALIVGYSVDHGAAALITQSLSRVTFPRLYLALHLLTNFKYWLKTIFSERSFRVMPGWKRLATWEHNIIFRILLCENDDVLLFKCHHVWPNMMVVAYYSYPS